MKLPQLGRNRLQPSWLRQEIFSLGGRHRGDALAGARIELKDPSLTAERRMLLRAVVSHLSAGDEAAGGDMAAVAKPARIADALYLAVICVAVIWIAVMWGRI